MTSVVWVLTHDLGRAGVPIALARMAAWLTEHDAAGVEVHVCALRSGPLAPELRRTCASVTTLDPEHGRSAASTVAVGAVQAGAARSAAVVRAASWRVLVRRLPTPDVVLVHGAGGWLVHRDLGRFLPDRTRLVVHLHELETGLDRAIPRRAQGPFLSSADRVLAVSEPVAELVRARAGADARVSIVPGVADEASPLPPVESASGARAVVSIGTPGWRKGTDRALAVAHVLARTHPDVTCRWIGGPPAPGTGFPQGVPLPLTMVDAASHPWQLVSPGSVLLVSSREDPLPLVALEAGRREIPVVAADTGGLADLLADRRGLVVAGHDLEALAGAVAESLDHPADAAARAGRLAEHVARCFTADAVGPHWLAGVLGVPAR